MPVCGGRDESFSNRGRCDKGTKGVPTYTNAGSVSNSVEFGVLTFDLARCGEVFEGKAFVDTEKGSVSGEGGGVCEVEAFSSCGVVSFGYMNSLLLLLSNIEKGRN